jgi:hypothetical protein
LTVRDARRYLIRVRSLHLRSVLLVASLAGCDASGLGSAASVAPDVGSSARAGLDVAAIYFPSWHTDDHYSSWYGEGWNEWQLVEHNPERFPGHHAPRPDPSWGNFDEADPAWMAKQIDLATEHGVNVFVFDWYWYSGVQMLQRPVEETLPNTPNRDEIKYALMWADHTWIDFFPVPYEGPVNWLLPIRHSAADFDRVMQHCIEHHFNQPNYWRVDGGAYFSFFAPEDFVRQLGGPEATRAVFDAARAKVRAAGLGELHFAAFTGVPQSIPDLEKAGFDSMTSYNVTTMSSGYQLPAQPFEAYDHLVERHEGYWDAMDTGVLPYAPVATLGWDVTPRWEVDVPWPAELNHYPYTPIVADNTPEKFGGLVRRALRQIETSKLPAPALFVNAWNEWTEGSALLPNDQDGTGYLDALTDALRAGPAD